MIPIREVNNKSRFSGRRRAVIMFKTKGKAQFFVLIAIIVLVVLAVYDITSDNTKSLSLADDKLKNINEKVVWISDLTNSEMLNSATSGLNGQKNNLLTDNRAHRISTKGSLFSGFRIVHLDLKGAPPKISYYSKFFPLIKKLGATGILVEYEDMFPYESAKVSAGNSYTKKDIEELLDLASKNNLDVIPLVQTFGHAEFILKLAEYKSLREDPRYPQVFCPTNNHTVPLLEKLIDEIILTHKSSKYIHIGCDEVYYLAMCLKCQQLLWEQRWNKKQLFLHHVKTIAEYITKRYPHITVLTWDDEFRGLSLKELKDAEIGSLVEPVVWKYTPEVKPYLNEALWSKYSAVFNNVWIASAFKGATSSNSFTTDIEFYLENHKAWIELVESYSIHVNFKGAILTGWQRYDHFAILCELLPVGIPSLAINLAYFSGNDYSVEKVSNRAMSILKCNVNPLLVSTSTNGGGDIHCDYPGSGVFENINKVAQIISDMESLRQRSAFKGWFSRYNIDHKFSNPAHVEEATADVIQLAYELNRVENELVESMSEVYDNYTITEWIYTYLKPLKDELSILKQARIKLLETDEWPKRPLKDNLSGNKH